MTLLEQTFDAVRPPSPEWRARAHARLGQLTMPYWALGRVMDLAEDLAGISCSLQPPVKRRAVVVMAGDHGVVAKGVSKFPQEVTVQMVYNFVGGGAGINALARQSDTDVIVVDMGVAGDLSELVASGKIVDRKIAPGTADLGAGPAMTRDQAIQAVESGIALANELADRYDVFGTGEMGIGNTTAAAAILCAITGCDAGRATGRGTGLDDEALAHKIAVIDRAVALHSPNPKDGLEVLATLGGFEIGGLTGLILGAAAHRKPVVIDGFITGAAALVAQALCPECVDYLIAAHNSVEPGHRLMWQQLGKEPLLDLRFRLGEGTGAALAMNLLDAAVAVLTEVATFGEAGVSEAGG